MAASRYLIIGGGVAGTTAASTIRQNSEITIVSDEPHYLYSRLMLSKPNFFLGKIPFDQIWLRDKKWYKTNRINFIGGKTAARLDHTNQQVTLDDGLILAYDKLLLATGVCPRPLPIPGIEKTGIHYLRTLDDGKSIIESVNEVKAAVTIGGGFISFEMANLLQLSGAKVSIIIREPRFWASILDATASSIIEQAIAESGVKLVLEAEVKEIQGKDKVTGVILKDNHIIACDLVICGIGAICNIDWLNESGVDIDRGILTDDHLKTNLPNIWGAGDAARFDDPILEEEVQLGNWVNAQEQGRVAALNMVGEDLLFTFVSFYTTHGFDSSITFVGNVRPQKEYTTITRHGPADNQHAQLMIVENELVGAVLINQTAIMKVLTDIIRQNIKVNHKLDQLQNPDFDLNILLNN